MNKRGPALMDKKISNEYIVFTIFISAGIMLRFIAMSLGHNYDFESYCVVGEIAGNFKNVYANTYRYNYGPIFFMIHASDMPADDSSATMLTMRSMLCSPLARLWRIVLAMRSVTGLSITDTGSMPCSRS